MSDSFLSISKIANDEVMVERMNAAVSQQQHLGNITVSAYNYGPAPASIIWVQENRYIWASSPDWAAAWDSALAGGNESPGADPAVITDGMILSTVQALLGLPEESSEE